MSNTTATTRKSPASKGTASKGKGKPNRAVTVTAKNDTVVPRGLASATVKAFTTRANVHRQRADVIRRIRNLNGGMSIRGTVAVMTVALEGHNPDGFSKGNIERYFYVIDALAAMADKGPNLDALPLTTRDAIVADLFRIAGPGGGKEAVTKAASAASGTENPEMVPVILGQHKAAVNAANVASVTRKPARPVGGEAADGGKPVTASADTAETPAETPQSPAPTPQRDALQVIAELSRIVAAPGFRPTEALITAFDGLAMMWEEAAATPATIDA